MNGVNNKLTGDRDEWKNKHTSLALNNGKGLKGWLTQKKYFNICL